MFSSSSTQWCSGLPRGVAIGVGLEAASEPMNHLESL